MSRVTIYSKLPAAFQFENPNTGRTIVVLGTNSHKIKTTEEQPVKNGMEQEDWEYFKEKFKDPSHGYFDKRKGDTVYQAADDADALIISQCGEQVIADKNVITKTPNVKKFNNADNL
jgi:formylmethanofuran dehydrogenase subunit E